MVNPTQTKLNSDVDRHQPRLSRALTPDQTTSLIWVIVVQGILDRRQHCTTPAWVEMIRRGEYVEWVAALLWQTTQAVLEELEAAQGLVESRAVTGEYVKQHLPLKGFLYFVHRPAVIEGLTYDEWEQQQIKEQAHHD